jgi:hypothetical protein
MVRNWGFVVITVEERLCPFGYGETRGEDVLNAQ